MSGPDRVLRSIAAASAAIFVSLSILVMAGATLGFDRAVTLGLQPLASPLLDRLANDNTVIGQATVTAALALLLSLWAWRREAGPAWLVPLVIIVPVAVGLLLKLVLFHPPPGPEFIRATGNPLGISIATPSAYPSGHIARIAFLTIVTGAFFRQRWLRIVLGLILAFTVFARVYIGDHWVSDAVGGLALGGGSACAALAWWRRVRVGVTDERRRGVAS